MSTLRETLGLGLQELLTGLLSAPFIWVVLRVFFDRMKEDADDFKREWPIHLFNLLPGPDIYTWQMVKCVVLVVVCGIVLAFWYNVIGLVIA
jgi:hypothetical protein